MEKRDAMLLTGAGQIGDCIWKKETGMTPAEYRLKIA